MKEKEAIKLFKNRKIRVEWMEEEEKWYFSIVDVIGILSGSINPQAYWRKLKECLKKEGNETVTNCHGLKMKAIDGKMRTTDVADTEQLLRLIQSIPSPKAEPFKLWLAKVTTTEISKGNQQKENRKIKNNKDRKDNFGKIKNTKKAFWI